MIFAARGDLVAARISCVVLVVGGVICKVLFTSSSCADTGAVEVLVFPAVYDLTVCAIQGGFMVDLTRFHLEEELGQFMHLSQHKVGVELLVLRADKL